MSPRSEVPLLNEISLTIVAKQVIDALASLQNNSDASLEFVMVSSYFESLGVTGDIYQDLLNLILNSDYLDPTVRLFAMKLLLRENVKTLATGIFPPCLYTKIMDTILLQGSGLTALNLKGVWVKDEQLHLLYDMIKLLHNLSVLTIPHMANDEVLKFLGEFSDHLTMLDISGETDVTEIGIDALCNGSPMIKESLTVVNIGAFGEENICHTDVALLIAHLPNLTNLGSYSFVGKSVHHLVKTRQCRENFKSKLQYVHDTGTSREVMQSIIRVCPVAETIYLEQPDRDVISQIENLEKVSRVKLTKFRCHDFHQLVERMGQKINSIMLSQSTGSLNLTRVAEKCRNLTSLECYKLDAFTHDEELQFYKLEHIEIIHSNITTSCFKYLMTCTPVLNKFIIGDEIKLTDSDMARLLRNNKFEQLEAIWFTNAPLLTRDTVENMMEACPKLQSLGQLSGWAVTPDDMMLLKAIIDSTNTHLVLSPHGHIFG